MPIASLPKKPQNPVNQGKSARLTATVLSIKRKTVNGLVATPAGGECGFGELEANAAVELLLKPACK